MKNIRWTKRITAFLLALFLGAVQVDAAVTTGGYGTNYSEKEHSEVPLDEMSRELFDQDAFDSAVEELSGLVGRRGREDRARELYRVDRKSTRLNSSHVSESRMPSSA